MLAVAFRDMARTYDDAVVSDETELTFAGFALFVDPPKQDAAEAIRALASLGVEVKILTGDNERVARHVCSEIGVAVKGMLTGPELAHMTDEERCAHVCTRSTFLPEFTPQQKERILLALKRASKIVGFLGDGINDASALHVADVGISVDTGADVAKEAADLVLLEHDLGVVHDGIVEGRRTVENVTKYILMGSSSNFGNMFSMAGAALFLPFLPTLPTQVLLNNLLYDVSEVGVPFDNVDAEAIQRPVLEQSHPALHAHPWAGKLVVRLPHFFRVALAVWSCAATFNRLVDPVPATESLVIFVVRTRGSPWDSMPHPLLTILTIGVVLVGS